MELGSGSRFSFCENVLGLWDVGLGVFRVWGLGSRAWASGFGGLSLGLLLVGLSASGCHPLTGVWLCRELGFRASPKP